MRWMRLLWPSARRSTSKAGLLLLNLNHPSLHAKKYNEAANEWQARVNRGWRFYFKIEGGTYEILKVVPHPK